MRQRKTVTAAAVFTALIIAGTLIDSKSGQAFNDNNGAQDEKLMSRTGLEAAASAGIELNMAKDPDMVGLGSYLVNVSGDCNACHTANPATRYLPSGNPYQRPPPDGPFLGTKLENTATYLGGGRDFGSVSSPGGAVHVVSRNLTPDSTGVQKAEHAGGIHPDHENRYRLRSAHPNCPTNTPQCLLPPLNGDLLQVMPSPNFRMTDRDLTAIYIFLSALPCIEGGPGGPTDRCK